MRVKADGDFVRRQNRLLLLETLRRYGPLARIELGRKTGLSPATVTSITGDMVAEGVLVSSEDAVAARPSPGRPMQRLRLNPEAASVLGIEISIDASSFMLTAYDGSEVAREVRHERTSRAVSRSFGPRLATEARHFLKRHGRSHGPLRRVGVSVQGIADVRRGSIAWSPAFRSRDIAIVEPLEAALGVKTTISNDTNLAALALINRRPEAFSGSAAVVFVGYGVGMGLIVNGAVYAGPNGAAAEFGHMNHIPEGPCCRCGRRGCIEAYAADYGVVRRAGGVDPASAPPLAAVAPAIMHAIEEQAKCGEPDARAAFQEAGLALGYGLARAIALLDLERVAFVGSGVSAMGLLEPSIRQGLLRGLPVGLQRNIPIEVESARHNLMTDGLTESLLGDVDRRIAAHAGESGTLVAGERA